jgi:phosphoribosyl 1,2-cyclic phosphodiesterase
MKSLGAIDESLFHIIRPGESFHIHDMTVHPFSIPHDARDPVSYLLEDGHSRIGMVTDLGYFDQSIIDALPSCDLLYVEANHDLRMLETGPYPYQLKCRIAGNYGHLCNEMAGQLIGQLLNERLQHVILGHLSKENNLPDLALWAVKNELARDFSVSEETLNISVAPRDHAMSVITI